MNLVTAVHTKSNQLMRLRLCRIHPLLQRPLLKQPLRIPSLLRLQQESTKKTDFPTTTIEAGRVLLHYRRIYAHALARHLARPLLPTRRCRLKKRRVCFSTNAPIDGNHGQATIGMHLLVGSWYNWRMGCSSTSARWPIRQRCIDAQ